MTDETPPIFLVHALDDTAVPPENSFEFLAALRDKEIPSEAHFFMQGGHGFGPGKDGSPSQQWLNLFDLWINQILAE